MIGEELKAARLALGLRQEDLAALLTTTLDTISRWEQRKVAIRHPGMLALAMEALARRQDDRETSGTSPYDTPESVERKARAARAVIDHAIAHLSRPQE